MWIRAISVTVAVLVSESLSGAIEDSPSRVRLSRFRRSGRRHGPQILQHRTLFAGRVIVRIWRGSISDLLEVRLLTRFSE